MDILRKLGQSMSVMSAELVGISLVLVAFLTRKYIVRWCYYLVMRIQKKERNKIEHQKLMMLLRPFDWLFVLGVVHGVLVYRFASFFQLHLLLPFRILYILLIAWACNNMLTAFGQVALKKQEQSPSMNQSMTGLLVRTLKVLLATIGLMMIISELGYDMNGLLAGVGLGGLAIALAAQDILGNFFGCIVIVFDKPFLLGDWIETSSLEGIVEDITFRSTRIRTFDHSVVSVPNSKLVNDSLTNWSKMKRRKLQLFVGVRYETTQQQLEACLHEIKERLKQNPSIIASPIRVYLNALNHLSMELRVECYVDNHGFDSFLAFKEQIQFMIIEVIKNQGVSFAYFNGVDPRGVLPKEEL